MRTNGNDWTHLERLEYAARGLEPNAAELDELFGKTVAYARRHLSELAHAPAYVEREDAGRALTNSPITEDGIPIDEALTLLRDNVDSIGIDAASSRFLGYIPGGGLVHSALGDLLAAVANRYAAVYYAGPGAVRMEHMLVRWMASLYGYPDSSGGFLSSGGSLANLSAIVAAREVHGISGSEIERSVVYLTNDTHYCVGKALRIAGLSKCPGRFVQMDENFRMSSTALEEAIRKDRKAGLRPWLLVSSTGTTNTGAVDPIGELGDIASAHGLWHHIEGAYGAFFILCEEGREVLHGMDRSDSIIMDPHKTLFLPYGTGAVIVKERNHLFNAHRAWADYLQDIEQEMELVASAFLSPELTKHFRALRMWLPLKVIGLAAFRAALSEKIQLARYFHERLQQMPGFEVGPYPDLSVVTFRYVPPRGDANLFNQQLTDLIHADGRVFLSSTLLQDKLTLRLAVVCFRTHRDHIDLTLEILLEKVEMLLDLPADKRPAAPDSHVFRVASSTNTS